MPDIRTVEGIVTPTQDDQRYMDYLDELWNGEYGNFGLLLFKGDPASFRIGRDEWLSEQQSVEA